MNKKGDNSEEIDELARMAKEIHKLNPKYVLVTATRAIPSSIALKSALKEAYSNEEQPYFLFVDSRAIKNKDNVNEFERRINIDKFIKAHSKNSGKEKILIYDETYGKEGETKPEQYAKGETGRAVRKSLTDPHSIWRVFDVDSYIKTYGNEEVWNLDGNGGVMAYDENIYERYGAKSSGFRRHKHGKEGLEIISRFKKLGIKAGNTLKAHQNGNLENKLISVIAIGSLLISVLFLSSNITGNAIADLPQTSSNWIGAILFLIGLAGAFFYFKAKRTKK